ncbi:MAG: hypothetical protein U1F55_08040 [Chitinivorax sp.]
MNISGKHLAALLTVLLSQPLMAHDNATLDAMSAPNGGMIRMAGSYHLELVLQSKQARVYVTDHAGKPIATQGSSAELTLMGKTRQQIRLQPAGGNLLRGDAGEMKDVSYQAILRLHMAGQQEQLTQFTGVKPRR